jgi:hypothetical protein
MYPRSSRPAGEGSEKIAQVMPPVEPRTGIQRLVPQNQGLMPPMPRRSISPAVRR